MNELEVKRVPFMGTDLMAAKDESGTIWVGVRWMCDGMGLSKGQRDRQITNINADSVISKGAANLRLPTAGGKQSVLCLKLDFVPLWLAKINITPAMQAETPELAERLEAYQLKAKDVLAAAFLPKKVQGGKPKPMTSYQQMMAEKWERDHALQEARIYTGMAKRYKGTNWEQVLNAYTTKSLSGQFLVPLPAAGERLLSAEEIGAKLGISANMVGRLTNQHHLKTEQYGEWFHDKARYSDKQVPSFRYKECVVDKLREIPAEL